MIDFTNRTYKGLPTYILDQDFYNYIIDTDAPSTLEVEELWDLLEEYISE